MIYGVGKWKETCCRCVCDCGNEVIKKSRSLRENVTPPSCGCMDKMYKEKQSSSLRKDLVGVRFGRLVVTDMVYETNKKTLAKCVCDCGSTITRVATYLTSGNTTSCGCYQKEAAGNSNSKDFSGTSSAYGVVLISRAYKDERGVWQWSCKCHCGNTFIALPAKVLNGHITSCGCARKSSRERLIASILDKADEEYYTEYRFQDCCDTRPLPFDFYIPTFNTLIEYQGQQHYAPIEMFGGDDGFAVLTSHDKIKKEYCKSKNINLLELPYYLTDDEITEKVQALFIRRDCNGVHSNA